MRKQRQLLQKKLLKISSNKNKKLKTLLKKDVKPRYHFLRLEGTKESGYADGNDPVGQKEIDRKQRKYVKEQSRWEGESRWCLRAW